jgi:hypothetical protein
MATDSIKSLMTAPGLAQMSANLRGASGYFHEPENIEAVRETVRRYLQEDPRLADIKLVSRPGAPGAYSLDRDAIRVGVSNPAVVGHELGHAVNLRNAPLYRKILKAAEGVARLNNTVALPAMLALRAFVNDKDTRNEIFSILSGTSAAVAAPGLVEEMSASMRSLRNVPDKTQALKTLIPAFLSHAVVSLAPTAVYQAGKYF